MNKEDIIRMAQETGVSAERVRDLVNFAALVADHVYAKYLETPEPIQSGTISVTVPVPIGYLCENAVGHRYFRWKKPTSTYKPIPLYTKEQA